jgi:hypothetical protein
MNKFFREKRLLFLVDFVDDCFDSFFVFHRSMKVGGRRTMSGSRTLSGNLPRFILNHFLSTSHEKDERRKTRKSQIKTRERVCIIICAHMCVCVCDGREGPNKCVK